MPHLDKEQLLAVLSGSYTSTQLRDFAELCYSLAAPIIRKRVANGRLKLHAMQLSERDIIQDALGGLFARKHDKQFHHLITFFHRWHPDMDAATDAELQQSLRVLVAGKIGKEIIRLLTDADPVLADVLRNIKLGLRRTRLFYLTTRFNDKFLMPCEGDPLLDRPEVPDDMLERELWLVCRPSDNVPELLRKLHVIVMNQEHCRRIVPFIPLALIFRKIITLHESNDNVSADEVESGMAQAQLAQLVRRVLKEVSTKAHKTYVEHGKCTEGEFDAYAATLKTIFDHHVQPGQYSDETFMQTLSDHLGGLTIEEYTTRHKSILEYMVRMTKERLKGLDNELRA
ncbi:MAG: hypothetical protein ACKVRP_01035 [Bacteroidota bacterium]